MKQKMIATKAFPYASRALKVGDAFEALDDKDALILSGLGKARYVTDPIETRDLSASDTDEEKQPERIKRRYRRRDMRADV